MTKFSRSQLGFNLLELLVVMTIMALLSAFSLPALQSLTAASSTNKGLNQILGTLEAARAYAMANHTYVRVGFASVTSINNPATAVTVLASTDGSLTYDNASAMANDSYWSPILQPLIVRDLLIYDSLNGSSPNTATDSKPSSTDIAAFSRCVAALGTVSFNQVVQFSPSGEAGVLKSEAARYIKIAMDQPLQPTNTETARNKNPFILRLSGINGSVDVLRKESLQ